MTHQEKLYVIGIGALCFACGLGLGFLVGVNL